MNVLYIYYMCIYINIQHMYYNYRQYDQMILAFPANYATRDSDQAYVHVFNMIKPSAKSVTTCVHSVFLRANGNTCCTHVHITILSCYTYELLCMYIWSPPMIQVFTWCIRQFTDPIITDLIALIIFHDTAERGACFIINFTSSSLAFAWPSST